MATWATRRKLTYVSIVVAILLVGVALPTFKVMYKPPTCQDAKQNQGEFGVDCGGPCRTLCPALAVEPIVSWQRVFRVSPGIYNAIAFVQNSNVNSTARDVRYIFRVFDEQNVLIADRRGSVDMLPNSIFPIFEPNMFTGEKTPTRVTFDFTTDPDWQIEQVEIPEVAVVNKVFSRESTRPTFDVTLENKTLKSISNMPVIAILYDVDGNALAASRTIIDFLDKSARTTVTFTWPLPFDKTVSAQEVYPIISLPN